MTDRMRIYRQLRREHPYGEFWVLWRWAGRIHRAGQADSR